MLKSFFTKRRHRKLLDKRWQSPFASYPNSGKDHWEIFSEKLRIADSLSLFECREILEEGKKHAAHSDLYDIGIIALEQTIRKKAAIENRSKAERDRLALYQKQYMEMTAAQQESEMHALQSYQTTARLNLQSLETIDERIAALTSVRLGC